MAYTVPQLLISQEFTPIATFTASPLAALIIGPDLRKGAITAIALGTAGSGYYNPVVTVTDATGADAVINATMATNNSKGAINSVTLGAGGTLYTVQPTVSISDPTGSGAQITATWNSSTHAVTGYVVVTGGSNYTSPVLTVNRGVGDTTGSGATGTAVLGTGAISGYTVVNGGAGYTAPVITVVDSNVPTGGVAGSSAAPGTVSLTSSYTLTTSLSGVIGQVNSDDDILAAFGTTTDTGNTLAYGLHNAVQNADNTTVYYCAVATNDLAGYTAALALAEKSNAYYGIVPLTNETETAGINNLVVTHVNAMSNPAKAKWRVCWLAPTFTDVTTYLANESLNGTQSINDNSGPRRIRYVFPDTYYPVDTPSVAVKGYFLAAALAGLRAGAPPHQSLTNTEVKGPYYLDKSLVTVTESDLNKLAGHGTWIVTQAVKGSIAFTRHQLTADNSLTFREDTITANVDSISYGLQAALEPFIGIYNITPANLLKVRAAIDAELSFRLTNTFTARAGNQLLGYTIVSIAQDAVQPDKINVVVTLQVPYPMNYITVSLSI